MTNANDFTDVFYTSTDGLRLYARDYASRGTAEKLPIICIHGLTRNSGDFDELAPLLAQQGHRVIAVDVRGRGRSAHDTVSAHYHPWVYAGDIVQLAKTLQISCAIFIGTSMGGLITMTLALRKSSLIAAAVLNDVGPYLSPRGLQRIASYAGGNEQFASWNEACAYIQRINEIAFPNNTAAEWDKWARRAFVKNAQEQWVLQYDPKIAIAIKTGKLKPTSWLLRWAFRRLSKARPCLLIRGETSDLMEAEQADTMRAMAPTLRYAEVPGVGHAPMMTEVAAQSALLRFINETELRF
ncbi:MAG: alpha/beta hydrolase [Burkholderiales bacterium]|nr:alpha/beta hydrolase [Burkholderiales bacterium]